jgi:transcriptional regulator GlxA family with amidase domain
MTTTGILLFEGVEELDFAGPWEVLTMGKLLRPDDRVVTIARTLDPVRCAKGLRVLPDHAFEDAPALDVLLVPGGDGTRRLLEDRVTLDFVQRCAASAQWTTSVCSGSLVLAAAGLLDGRKATTHWAVLPELRRFERVDVLDHVRYVRDGQVVSAAGVSAGIDMALWLFGQLSSPADARKVQRFMQYDPAPPYQGHV